MTILSVENLSIGYNTKKGLLTAVNNISFSLEHGRSLGFVGESGCGKTTIGMALMGLLPENAAILSGKIHFSGEDLSRFTEKQWRNIRGKEIAMIFQAAMNALNPVFRVGEQIAEAITTHNPDLSTDKVNDRLKTLFNMVEIPESRMSDFPHEYSGGMKQRAIIAMALACSPKLVVADEPTTALDVIVQDQILKEIKKIQKAMNMSLIFISHDIAVVAEVCENICVMYAGQIVEMGTKQEVFKSPKHPYTKTLLASYLSLDSDEDIFVPDMMETPDLTGINTGCRFSVNCNCKSKNCSKDAPGWIDLTSTHKAFCCEQGLGRKQS
ncbi:MAG: ABC transporter ATP-binding protein [Proteobacteria bacterium]|nr:ABC transporter ATP-binding protein [Pseudomonadota bacterium]MBU1586242.1 ABC transporter ATP-binding protein [Pseudomonadota bacterium]MBU2454560.1 ABC transporter ATP-binding protein [Pseudomonadota bacterium]MBU2627545.1 ABC transporter ATP-binding protein [Pseudomonadota bacterium]